MSEQQTESPTTERERYESPSIVEDLPLESYSLGCDKSTGCEGGITTS